MNTSATRMLGRVLARELLPSELDSVSGGMRARCDGDSLDTSSCDGNPGPYQCPVMQPDDCSAA